MKVAGGRMDVVVFMPDAVYVMELKVGESAQISARGYAAPYQTDGRRVVKVGVSADEHTVEEWAVGNDK